MMATPETGYMIFRTAGMLLVVIIALLAVLYAMRRLSSFRGIKGRGRVIDVTAVHHFSPRERLALVTVHGRTLLLGVTAQSITCLAALDAGEELLEIPPAGGGFRGIMEQNLSRTTQRQADEGPVKAGEERHDG
jgi:flagellar biosynthetic protein FliO